MNVPAHYLVQVLPIVRIVLEISVAYANQAIQAMEERAKTSMNVWTIQLVV